MIPRYLTTSSNYAFLVFIDLIESPLAAEMANYIFILHQNKDLKGVNHRTSSQSIIHIFYINFHYSKYFIMLSLVLFSWV